MDNICSVELQTSNEENKSCKSSKPEPKREMMMRTIIHILTGNEFKKLLSRSNHFILKMICLIFYYIRIFELHLHWDMKDRKALKMLNFGVLNNFVYYILYPISFILWASTIITRNATQSLILKRTNVGVFPRQSRKRRNENFSDKKHVKWLLYFSQKKNHSINVKDRKFHFVDAHLHFCYEIWFKVIEFKMFDVCVCAYKVEY